MYHIFCICLPEERRDQGIRERGLIEVELCRRGRSRSTYSRVDLEYFVVVPSEGLSVMTQIPIPLIEEPRNSSSARMVIENPMRLEPVDIGFQQSAILLTGHPSAIRAEGRIETRSSILPEVSHDLDHDGYSIGTVTRFHAPLPRVSAPVASRGDSDGFPHHEFCIVGSQTVTSNGRKLSDNDNRGHHEIPSIIIPDVLLLDLLQASLAE